MTTVNLAIIYYSSTGINHQLSSWAEESAKEAGANVKVLKVPELAPEEAIAANPAWQAHYKATKDVPNATSDDIEWADALLFSTPTRFGALPAQMKQFIDMQGDLWGAGKTVNKVVSGMASAKNPHGGQEATILSLYTSMMHWGAIIAPTGYSDNAVFAAGGNPYGTSVSQGDDGQMVEDVEDVVKHQARRTVDIAARVKAGA